MTRRFVTMREIVAGPELDERRQAFRNRQVTGRIVMLDRRCPYDPGESIYMALVATDAGGLVRVPVTMLEVKALIDFAMAEGEPLARGAADIIRLRDQVEALEREIAGLKQGADKHA